MNIENSPVTEREGEREREVQALRYIKAVTCRRVHMYTKAFWLVTSTGDSDLFLITSVNNVRSKISHHILVFHFSNLKKKNVLNYVMYPKTFNFF